MTDDALPMGVRRSALAPFHDPGLPGPADVEYFTRAQADGWGDMLRAFARFMALPDSAAVLDVGTGPGLLAQLIVAGGARLTIGCDDSWPMLIRAAELTAAGLPKSSVLSPVAPCWLAGDACRLPLKDATLDAVAATNLLFLLPQPAVGLAELCRMARPGGIVAFLNPTDAMSVPAAETFADQRGLIGFARFSFVNYARLAEEHHRLSSGRWIALAQAAGLTELQVEARAAGMVGFVRGRKVL